MTDRLWRSPWLPIGAGIVGALAAWHLACLFLQRFAVLFGSGS